MDGSDHNDRHLRKLDLGLFQKANAIEIAHHEIGEHEGEIFAGGQNAQRVHARTRLLALIAGSVEHGADDFANGVFVVNDQYLFANHGDSGSRKEAHYYIVLEQWERGVFKLW